MIEADMRKFAELAQDFFAEKLKESGVAVIKKAWASNEDEGLLIVVSCFGKHSKEIAELLSIPWEPKQPKDQQHG